GRRARRVRHRDGRPRPRRRRRRGARRDRPVHHARVQGGGDERNGARHRSRGGGPHARDLHGLLEPRSPDRGSPAPEPARRTPGRGLRSARDPQGPAGHGARRRLRGGRLAAGVAGVRGHAL
ncbi:MAG: hypothetical protein AVDCRST_MAG38-2438, partial [uncultured Solirubrobacteraceae bacterium]